MGSFCNLSLVSETKTFWQTWTPWYFSMSSYLEGINLIYTTKKLPKWETLHNHNPCTQY